MVSARRCHFHCRHRLRLTSHVGHVDRVLRVRGSRPTVDVEATVERCLHRLSPGPRDKIRKVCKGNGLNPRYEGCLTRARGRDDHAAHPARARREHRGEDSAHRLNAAIESQFPNDHGVFEG